MILLPDGWHEVKIQELTTRTKQRDPRKNPEEPFRYVDVSSVNNTLFKIENATDMYGAQAPSRARKEIKANDVLFATVRPTLKRIALVPNELDGQIASTGYCVLRPGQNKVIPAFLYHALLTDRFIKTMGALERGANYPAVRDSDVFSAIIPLPPIIEQQRIAYVLSTVQTAIEQQDRLLKLTRELKSALMQKLFTEGLRGEKQKMTEIGPVPKSWEVNSLKQHCNVVTSSLPYMQLIKLKEYRGSNAVELLGIKVSDMNLPGNENRILKSNLIKKVNQEFAQKKAVPPGTVVFPKRGAAIATNKKRLTTTWTVFDPNLIGVKTKEGLSTEFIYYWFQRFDLRRITDPGPTPQLNKKDLEPLLIPIPQDISEQIEIADILGTIDNKINLISEKKGKLEELFRTLLHQLMTGKIRVNDIDLPGLSWDDNMLRKKVI